MRYFLNRDIARSVLFLIYHIDPSIYHVITLKREVLFIFSDKENNTHSHAEFLFWVNIIDNDMINNYFVDQESNKIVGTNVSETENR